MTLTQVTERVHIYEGGVNFAIVVAPEQRLILVDSGLDSSSARKALKPFFDSGHRLTHIINTHSHADHIGGNADLVRRTGCQVWAPAKERPFILWPELEPVGLYGGAWPPSTLQVKFLQAQPTPAVTELPPAPATVTFDGLSMELIPTPGHALEQVAIAVDGVLVAADGIFMPEVIARHPITFLVNVADYLDGLDRIAAREERFILPGHGPLIRRAVEGEDPLPGIVAENKASLERLQSVILQQLEMACTSEELLYTIVQTMGKQLESDPQFFLDRAAIAAHLSYLERLGHVKVEYTNGRRLLSR